VTFSPSSTGESREEPRQAPSHSISHPLRTKTSLALCVTLAALLVPYASPRLRPFRVLGGGDEPVAAGAMVSPIEVSTATPALGETALKASRNEATITNALPEGPEGSPKALPAGAEADKGKPTPESAASRGDVNAAGAAAASATVEDPTGHALDPFYERLRRTDAKEPGAVTRILHYGDSVITGDYISGTMRRRMQARFGDAGHGFLLIANPWEWYFHNDVSHWASDGWKANRITGPLAGDGLYGLGGVSFRSSGPATATFGTADKGQYGRRVSRFDIYYLEQPFGGDLLVAASGKAPERFSTRGPAKVSRVHSVEVADGAATLTVRVWGNGDVRLFGVVLERGEAGVSYDALGANGARAKLWESMSGAHWRDQMQLRDPSLIILQYGTNESETPVLKKDTYEASLTALVKKVKSAAPSAAIVIAAPLDRAERAEGGRIRTRAVIPELVAAQREVALAEGCGFFDTFSAMGGQGTIARWLKADPALASWDFTHPTPAGAEVLGGLLYGALLEGYARYTSAHQGAPKP
jgi:lysophospholipase L1-like esterase